MSGAPREHFETNKSVDFAEKEGREFRKWFFLPMNSGTVTITIPKIPGNSSGDRLGWLIIVSDPFERLLVTSNDRGCKGSWLESPGKVGTLRS